MPVTRVVAGIPRCRTGSRYPQPVIVYLTGGIGTGKSTVLGLFAELGAHTLSADDVVRDLYAEPDVQKAIADALMEPLPLERARIAAKVFNDPVALQRLELILHPRVRQIVRQAELALGPTDALIYEVPLPPAAQPGDRVVVVRAPLATRMERLMGRGMSAVDASARIDAQADESTYGKSADYNIVNQGSRDELAESVRVIWEDLQNGTSRI